MNAAALLTPNAVARRQLYLDWAERAELARRRRALRRKALLLGVPMAALAGAVALTLSGAPQRLIAPAAEVPIAAPLPHARPAVPRAMVATVAPAAAPVPAVVGEARAHTAAKETPRVRRARIRRPTTNDDQADVTLRARGARGGHEDDAAIRILLDQEERDRLAALDAIRDLRLR